MAQKLSKMRLKHPHWSAFFDWVGVFTAVFSFVFIALWAASPDSALLTVETATLRSLSYAIPITLGMWGIARATRPGSSIPRKMAETIPYARMGADGKPEATSLKADRDGTPPTQMGGGDPS